MKLYYTPLSSYSQKVLMAIHEKEITSIERESVDLMDEKHREEYRRVYPLGKVPLLTAEKRFIPESSIIIEFLDTHFETGTQLLPESTELARETRFQDRMSDLYLHDSVGTLLWEQEKPKAEQSRELIERAEFRIDTTYSFMDKHFEDKEWANGHSFSLADCSYTPALFYAQKIRPYDKHKNIQNYSERLLSRPSFDKVVKEIVPYLEDTQLPDLNGYKND